MEPVTVPALPEDAVLVHLGPPKTGTTSIQASLDQHRADLLTHGVRYPGTGLRHRDAARALRGISPRGTRAAPAGAWDDLVAEVRTASARVCISAEELAGASPDQARRLVTDLGPDRVHLLLAVRRLDRLLPSMWQQRVRNAEVAPYERWLEQVLADGRTGAFWANHGVAELVRGWGEVLPPERLTLLIVDEYDRTQLTRTFQGLLDLPPGLLTPGPRQNSSLSYERVELYRRVAVIAEERGWDDRRRRALLHRGLLEGLHAAAPHEGERSAPPMPPWAWPRLVALSEARAEEVRTSGARVLGDPEGLLVVAPDDPPETVLPTTVHTDVAAAGIAELYELAVRREARAGRARRPRRSARLSETSSRRLLRELAARPMRRLRRRR